MFKLFYKNIFICYNKVIKEYSMATTGIIIDIVLLVILLIFGLVGFKKGLFNSLLSLFSWIVCIIVAIFLARFVAKWINGIYDFNGLIGGKINDSLVKVDSVFSKKIVDFKDAGGKDAIMAELNSVPNLNGFLRKLIKMVFNSSSFNPDSTATVGMTIGRSAGQLCMLVISMILTFIVLKIVIGLLSKLFDNISKVKIIGGLNKLFGLLFGIVKGLCIIVLFNAVLSGMSVLPFVNKSITPVIQDHTHVEKVVYNTTDKLMQKYVVEGKVVQKWIDDLWKK